MFHRKQSMRLIAYLPFVENGSYVESFTAQYTKDGFPRPYVFLQCLYIDLKHLFLIMAYVVSVVALKKLRAAPVLLAIELEKVVVLLQRVAVGSHAGFDPASAAVNDILLFHQTDLSVNPSFVR